MIDTHCHFNDEAYFNDLDLVINKALDNDVKKLIIVGFDNQTIERAIKITNDYECCYLAIGYHPEVANDINEEDLIKLEELIIKNKPVAIGEIGLDYYWVKDNKDKQKWLFRKQIELAKKYNLPIIIHSRDAIADTLEIVKEFDGIKGVMHAYSGSLEMAKEFIKKGFYLGIGGVITFNNAKSLKEVVMNIDLSKILLETDCPYLTPVPFRGKRNESSYIPLIAKKIAEIKEISIEEVSNITDENVKTLFNI